MLYILTWTDLFGRENHSKPESWENIGHIINAIRSCGHYKEGSFKIDFTFSEKKEA